MKLYIPVFSLTLLLSATLLFVVQPMFSKMILPLVGGSPQVWNTAMLFFQVCLLGGYAYAHLTTKLFGVRIQAIIHVILLIVLGMVLPFAIPAGWLPPEGGDPTLWQLSVMATTVGGPFFALSGSAPMFQRWFSKSGHKDSDNPYFLYGASNLGSMSSLLLYPFLIEPVLTLKEQANFWAMGYAALGCMTIICALMVWSKVGNKDKHGAENTSEQPVEKITGSQRLKWIILSFIPSSLMLGVTSYVTTDIASVPLLWVMPLAIYIGTFIIVFARKQIFTINSLTIAFGVSLIAIAFNQMGFGESLNTPTIPIIIHFVAFFFGATLCHLALAQSRPSAQNLTEFYLIMSFGGALGGFFNAIIVPNIFILPIEYPLVLLMAALVRHSNKEEMYFASVQKTLKKSPADVFSIEKCMALVVAILIGVMATIVNSDDLKFICAAIVSCLALFYLMRFRWAFAFAITIILLTNYVYVRSEVLLQDRNFFGVMRIVQDPDERFLMHGTTNHGTQPTVPGKELTLTSYYGPTSPVRDAYDIYDTLDRPQNVGVIGLGVGVLACKQKDGRHYDFFEIDKDIADIAEDPKYFTYLSGCGSPYDIILGDGRIGLQKQPDKKYDMIIGDAFSSDSIPIHIVTKEAFEMYLNKIKDDGIIVIHISNRHLDIEPVITLIGEAIDAFVYAKAELGTKIEGTDIESYNAHYIAMTRNPDVVEQLKAKGWSEGRKRDGVKMWTDDFSNIVSVLETKTQRDRLIEAYKRKMAREEAEADSQSKDDTDADTTPAAKENEGQ